MSGGRKWSVSLVASFGGRWGGGGGGLALVCVCFLGVWFLVFGFVGGGGKEDS